MVNSARASGTEGFVINKSTSSPFSHLLPSHVQLGVVNEVKANEHVSKCNTGNWHVVHGAAKHLRLVEVSSHINPFDKTADNESH